MNKNKKSIEDITTELDTLRSVMINNLTLQLDAVKNGKLLSAVTYSLSFDAKEYTKQSKRLEAEYLEAVKN